MRFHYVWLAWSSAFLIPWVLLFVTSPPLRRAMWRSSIATSALGLTEPVFVPRYWNPPSLFDLAHRTGFDIESLIFSFAIGGIGAVLYDALTRRAFAAMPRAEREGRRHRLHLVALWVPLVSFIPLSLRPWNPIYAALVSLAAGAFAAVLCRPDLIRQTMIGGGIFLALYGAFIGALRLFVPGYIASVWNLPALSGVMAAGIPVEELLFGASFGLYWASVYEHVTWRTTATAGGRAVRRPTHDDRPVELRRRTRAAHG